MISIQDLDQLIRTRRALYPANYTGETISNEVILHILENANWAPNHKKTEPWRFIIFQGERLVDLGEYLAEYYVQNTPPEQFSETKYRKTLKKMAKCSHVIAICMSRDKQESVPEWEEMAAVACAVQNMWLTCTALGIGCYWSTPKAALDGRDFLSLDPGTKCLGLFYIGVPKIKAEDIHGERGPISEKVRWA